MKLHPQEAKGGARASAVTGRSGARWLVPVDLET